jgi:cobalamin synthase
MALLQEVFLVFLFGFITLIPIRVLMRFKRFQKIYWYIVGAVTLIGMIMIIMFMKFLYNPSPNAAFKQIVCRACLKTKHIFLYKS